MSRFRSSITLAITHDEAHVVTLAAVDRLRWRLTSDSEMRITCQEEPDDSVVVNPARIAVSLEGDSRGPIEVTVNGANFGSAPEQALHVRSCVDLMVQALVKGAIQTIRNGTLENVSSRRTVIVNGARLAEALVRALESVHGWPMRDGAFWYDRVSGAWGVEGGPTAGFVLPGLDLGGPLHADASKGDTGVFVNGRELSLQDVFVLHRFACLGQGMHWVDALGNFGFEGGPRRGNLLDADDVGETFGGDSDGSALSKAATAHGQRQDGLSGRIVDHPRLSVLAPSRNH